jgi:hypothetical protein
MEAEDARQSILEGDTGAEYPRPVAATDAHIPQAGLKRRKPGMQPMLPGMGHRLVHALAGMVQMEALAVHTPPGIAQMEEFAVHTPPGIAQMEELAAHALSRAAHISELALDALPCPGPTTPPRTNPAADAVEPAPRDLGVIIIWITHEAGRKLLAVCYQVCMHSMEICFVWLAITPLSHPVRVGPQGAKDIGDKRILIIHCLDVRGMWPIEEDSQAPRKGFNEIGRVPQCVPDEGGNETFAAKVGLLKGTGF